ncbi:efflux RND transporter permease subunit [Desulforhabdus sp. TSK]|uniref:efflux RND transporter permease subunit n=1 Tax=Desulforhabdus sp. TSK TaxID=2925014 RepID=UPI001FC82CCE|nr:CusA/CzcA family heavy metal efflux RND transporter [Desulforhabdus sp. TSK]GKT07668.1 cation transporter [Desulforhabdus sp. TSK]
MISSAIDWSIRNRYLVLVLTVLFVLTGIWVTYHTPLDAIPDLSDTQVIVYAKYPGQSPQVVEDQVTYALTTAMLSVPKAKVVRGYSFFNFSLVYVIFEDGTDLYWARSRVMEYLNYVSARLPSGVSAQLGPDATGVGWVYQYALVDKSGKHSLDELRSLQDWYLRYQLQTVPGVSEVASIGGYVKQYQIEVDPNKLAGYGISLSNVKRAVQRSNMDVGGGLVESSEMEYMVRGLGYVQGLNDLRKVVIGVDQGGIPVLLGQVANIHLGPELRRGVADLNGQGDVAGGVVVMRFGGNALETIKAVKQKLEDLKAGLPDGVQIVPVYDRSSLIERSISFLRQKLIEELVIVSLVCMLFLFHFRSALVAIFILPLGVMAALIAMYFQGLNSNIMSLGGIAIAMGAMVDSAIIMIENAHKKMEHGYDRARHWEIIASASKEVGPALFWALLVITVSFLPIFSLTGQSGRLFKPLAFTKTYAMGASAFLAVLLAPVLMGFFIRGRIRSDEENPVTRFLIWGYHPVAEWVLHHRKTVLLAAVLILASAVYPLMHLGSEFMPPLNEGDLLYMPTTLPGVSITKAKELLQQTDRIIKTFPEVKSVFGKVGRAETATDPAPLSMLETVIQLHQDHSKWRTVKEDRWYSSWAPGWAKKPLRYIWPEERPMTQEELVEKLNGAIHFPGLVNAWTMPIKTRTDMLSTGIKTPVGLKILGPDLDTLATLSREVEAVVRDVPGTRSVIGERVMGGYYMDYKIDRDAAARYGLTVADIQDVIESALGGMNVTQTVEGLERYPVNIRYMRDYRSNIPALERVLVPTPTGAQIPLSQLAQFSIHQGPPSIKTEGSRKTAWLYVDLNTSDIGGYVAQAKKIVSERVHLPSKYNIVWSGQFEYMMQARQRLMIAIPVTLMIIVLLLYFNTKSFSKVVLVMLAVPFSLVGSFWLLYLLHYNVSVTVVVGLIALAGLDAETGVVMLLYLDLSHSLWERMGRMNTHGDLMQAIYHGAVRRIRPKMMTVGAILAGLLPIMWGAGTGSEVMKRIATPMVGGVVTSLLLELTIYPVLYFYLKGSHLESTLEPTSREEVVEFE